MRGAPELSNIVEACNLEGRQERLDALLTQLELCEKALQARWIPLHCVYAFPERLAQTAAQPAGLLGDQARGVPALLLCCAGRSA